MSESKPSYDLTTLRPRLGRVIEDFLRIADTKVNWIQDPSTADSSTSRPFVFLPGVYQLEQTIDDVYPAHVPNPNEGVGKILIQQDIKKSDMKEENHENPDVKAAQVKEEKEEEQQVQEPAQVKPTPVIKKEDIPLSSYRMILHADNRFHYTWTRIRKGRRPMEHHLEMTGTWHSPMLNRDVYGNICEELNCIGEKVQFSRKSNRDPASGKWKLQLQTFERNDETWVSINPSPFQELGHNTEEKLSLPAIELKFQVSPSGLIRLDELQPKSIISGSTASRVLAGLSKKAVLKLGEPGTVMTDQWLLPTGAEIFREPSLEHLATSFDPLLCLAEVGLPGLVDAVEL